MRRVPTLLAGAALAAALAIGGCGVAESESSAVALAKRVLPQGFSTLNLEYRRELHDGGDTITGYAWRLARSPSAAPTSPASPTHLGVLACVRGDDAIEVVLFSYLHWDVASCDGARAQLRRTERSPKQDAESIGAVIVRVSPLERSAAVERARP